MAPAEDGHCWARMQRRAALRSAFANLLHCGPQHVTGAADAYVTEQQSVAALVSLISERHLLHIAKWRKVKSIRELSQPVVSRAKAS
jgi:hypothetical protein